MPADDHKPNPHRYVGRPVSFDHGGKRLVGVVESARYIGRTERGQIPDYLCMVRGSSGAVVEASLVESYMTFTESK